MKLIKCLSELIESEIEDACHYIDLAMKWKNDEPDTADVFYELSLAEMEHMDKLHGEVVELIEEYRKEKGEPPKEMLVLYDYLHERHIAEATQVRIKQGMYKET